MLDPETAVDAPWAPLCKDRGPDKGDGWDIGGWNGGNLSLENNGLSAA